MGFRLSESSTQASLGKSGIISFMIPTSKGLCPHRNLKARGQKGIGPIEGTPSSHSVEMSVISSGLGVGGRLVALLQLLDT